MKTPPLSAKSSNSLAFRLPLLAAAAVVTALPTASGVTLLSDNFTGQTVGTQPTGWYAYNSNAAGTSPLIATDNNAPLSGNVARYTSTANNSALVSSFATTTLAATGDYIEFTLDLRYTSTVTGNNSGPTFGLFNDNGTAFTANSFGSMGNLANDTGYEASKFINIGGSAATTNDYRIYGKTTSIDFYTFSSAPLNTTSSGVNAANTTPHAMTLRITRNATNGLDFTGGFDGYSMPVFTIAAGSVSTYTFNEAVILGAGGQNSPNANFDNILITTNVPEPSTGMLAALGLTTATVLRRRHRALCQ